MPTGSMSPGGTTRTCRSVGAAFCLGAALALLELRCAFPVLFVRLENLALTIAAQDVVYSRLTSFAARSACRSPSALPSLRE
ncbi:hypothetical protein N0Q91_00275 (plasmid) [Sinorhizobium sp. K101]|nr:MULTISPECIES: hypothetical protein [unclassified Sinorhizobium]WEJ08545.1 hypothetical protein N0Q90_02445 [Sinorhizobium sp. M103]WEJ13952.1 hypothetical protein N0Q91_00275 [Sinorhizobium sp. K101]WEJ35554.1 hypothetical protein N0R80_00270 [Sinorhizobium sp. C101]